MAHPTTDLSPHDFEAITAAHASIKQDLNDLKALAQPLLSSHTSLPGHSTSLSPDKTDLVGPGRYNVTGELGTRLALSVYRGAPSAVFAKAGAEIKGKKDSLGPAPGSYSPNTKLVYRSDPKVSFAGKDLTRLGYLDELKTRSPGPIYSLEPVRPSGGHISSSKRDTFRQFVRNNFPSPQAYSLDMKSKTMNGRFGKSGKSDYMKEYMPGMERLLKGREGEFTTNIDPGIPVGNGLLKASGHASLVDPSISTPGVGSYSTESLKSDRCKFSFPKAARRTDLKLK